MIEQNRKEEIIESYEIAVTTFLDGNGQKDLLDYLSKDVCRNEEEIDWVKSEFFEKELTSEFIR